MTYHPSRATCIFMVAAATLMGADVVAFLPTPGMNFVSSVMKMGLMDDLKLIFSEEGKNNRAAYEERQRREQEEAQRAILEARRNPEKMRQYEEDVIRRRRKLDEEQNYWSFQKDISSDPLQAWTKLRAQGKIKAGSDIERDPTSSRLGSEGLQNVRTDDKLPYIDQGWVDESAADPFAGLKSLFGGRKRSQ